MWDRFLVKNECDDVFYVISIRTIIENGYDIIQQERTFDNGMTWNIIQ